MRTAPMELGLRASLLLSMLALATYAQDTCNPDLTPPVLTCPADIAVDNDPGRCDALVTVPLPSASDNCAFIGAALNFDGTNDYVNAGNDGTVNFGSSDFTIEVWFRTTSTAFAYLVAKGGAPTTTDKGYGISLNGNGAVYGYIHDGVRQIMTPAGSDYNDGAWHHYAGVFDRDGNFTPYVDGVALTPTPIAATAGSVTGTPNLYIGRYTGSSGFWDGDIDEVRLWNTARTQAEIVAEMGQTLTGSEPGLVAYYHFNGPPPCVDNTGAIALLDQTANGNDGALLNFDLTATLGDPCSSNWTNGKALGGSLTASNNFTGTGDASGTYPVGATQVIWTATDAAGNSATCSMTVTVTDTQAPTIVCPADITVASDPGQCDATVAVPVPPATDNCGQPGGALNYDGVDDYVDLGNDSSVNFGTSDFTIEAWFRTSSSSFQYLVGKGGGSASGASERGYGIAVTLGSVYGFIHDGTRFVFSAVGGGYNDGEWHHYAGVFDRDANFTPYVDGVALTGTSIAANAGSVDSVAALNLGRYSNLSSTGFWDGDVDDVRLWSVARTHAEILANMGAALTGSEPGLAAYYTFNEGTPCADNIGVTVLPDQTPNGNDGALLGFDLTGGLGDACESNWTNGIAVALPAGAVNDFTGTGDASGTYPAGTTIVTWTASDAAGNSTTCQQTVTVEVACPDVSVGFCDAVSADPGAFSSLPDALSELRALIEAELSGSGCTAAVIDACLAATLATLGP